MGSEFDEMEGRAKQAVGDLTDDDDLEREGKMDQTGAEVKRKVDEARRQADEAIDAVKDELSDD